MPNTPPHGQVTIERDGQVFTANYVVNRQIIEVSSNTLSATAPFLKGDAKAVAEEMLSEILDRRS